MAGVVGGSFASRRASLGGTGSATGAPPIRTAGSMRQSRRGTLDLDDDALEPAQTASEPATPPLQRRGPPPPTGRVALVFTDVQDSTQIWEADQDAMSASVRVHHQEMRAGIRKYSGYEVKTEGDAFMIAFSTAREAVRWCLYMQEHLLLAHWPEKLLTCHPTTRSERDRFGAVIWRGLRVRMGVHTGHPEASVDPVTQRMDYYGPVVNLAARVSSTAKGGQIVLSKDAFDDVRGDMRLLGLPSIEDAGLQVLKGITFSVRTYTMVPDKLSQRDFSGGANFPKQAADSMITLVRELNERLSELDPQAPAQASRGRRLQEGVVSELSWLAQPLAKEGEEGTDERRLRRCRTLLDKMCPHGGSDRSNAQSYLDSADFGAPAHRVVAAACASVQCAAANIFDWLTEMVLSLPELERSALSEQYTAMLCEMQTQLRAADAATERAEEVREQIEAFDERVALLEEQLKAATAESDRVRKLVASIREEEWVLKTEPTAEACVVMLQVESVEALHRSHPELLGDSLVLLRCMVEALLLRYGGERSNYGAEHVDPASPRPASASFWTEVQRPVWCADSEYVLVFPRPDAAVWFCAELQRQLLAADWPQSILRSHHCARVVDSESGRRVWGGLRVRAAAAKGPLPMPRFSPKGVPWYSATVCHRTSRLLSAARGGETLVTAEVWAAYCNRVRGGESPRMAGDGILGADVSDDVRRVLPRSLAARGSDADPGLSPRDPAGRFLESDWWVAGAAPVNPTRPPDADLAHELQLRDEREARWREAVERLLQETRLPDGRDEALAEAHALLEAHERREMAGHDDHCTDRLTWFSSEPRRQLRKKSVVRRQKAAFAVLRQVASAAPAAPAHDLPWLHDAVAHLAGLARKYADDAATADELKSGFAERVLGPGQRFAALGQLALSSAAGQCPDKVADSCAGHVSRVLGVLLKQGRSSPKHRKSTLTDATETSRGKIQGAPRPSPLGDGDEWSRSRAMPAAGSPLPPLSPSAGGGLSPSGGSQSPKGRARPQSAGGQRALSRRRTTGKEPGSPGSPRSLACESVHDSESGSPTGAGSAAALLRQHRTSQASPAAS